MNCSKVFITTDNEECLSYCKFRECMIGSTACSIDCPNHIPILSNDGSRERKGFNRDFFCKNYNHNFREIVVKILK